MALTKRRSIDLAKTEEAKRLIELGIHYPSKITKTLALPPGTPADRAQILQKGLQQTSRIPSSSPKAEKAKVGSPVTADDMRKTVEGVFKTRRGVGGQAEGDAVLGTRPSLS